MAYLDESGKITIDEISVNQDISRLTSARNDLDNVKKQLQSILDINSSMLGPTADSINELTIGMLNSVNKRIESIDESVLFLKNTLAKYEAIDRTNKALTEQIGC